MIEATADALRTSMEVCLRGAIRAWIALVHYPQANPAARHGIASAQAICPSKPSVLAMSR